MELPDLLLSHGIDLRKRGNEYQCFCFAHKNVNTPAMSVYINDGGKWVCHCHSCGFHEDAIGVKQFMDGSDFKAAKAAVGEEVPEPTIKAAIWQWQKPPKGPRPNMALPKLTGPHHVWEYRDADGGILGYVGRYIDAETGRKSYRPWSYGTMSANIKPKWASKKWTAPAPLYGLDKLAKRPDDKVLVVEGEKAADAAQRIIAGMVAITWPGGASAVGQVDLQPMRGRRIVCIPDADIPGHFAMLRFARRALVEAGAESVSIVDSSDMPHGWDLADAEADEWDAAKTIAWARERMNDVTIDGLNDAITKAESEADEKKTPDETPALALVEPPRTVEVTVTEEVQQGNVVALRTKTMHLTPSVPVEMSPAALRDAWMQNEGKDWLYVAQWKTWFQWTGARWEADRKHYAKHTALERLITLCNEQAAMQMSPNARRALAGNDGATQVLALAGCHPAIARTPDDFDTDGMLLGTPEGVVDLRTGQLREARREDYVTKFAACAPKPGPMPYWDAVLRRCTGDDPEMIEYYQKWAGYLLTGETKEEAFLYIHGPQQSGKSKMINALVGLLGEYAATADVAAFMESKIERHSSEMASLAGARLVVATEPESGARWKEALVKKITGREKMQARRLYESPFEFEPQFKLVIGGNYRPLLSGGEGIQRRLHLAEFPPTIPDAERIIDLDKRLEAEFPAIMAWAVEGCLKWQRHGLVKPAAIANAVASYMDSEDTLQAWIDECCEIGTNYREASHDLHASYKKHVEAGGEGALGQRRLTQEFERRGFGKGKSNGKRYILGLRVKPLPIGGGYYGD